MLFKGQLYLIYELLNYLSFKLSPSEEGGALIGCPFFGFQLSTPTNLVVEKEEEWKENRRKEGKGNRDCIYHTSVSLLLDGRILVSRDYIVGI